MRCSRKAQVRVTSSRTPAFSKNNSQHDGILTKHISPDGAGGHSFGECSMATSASSVSGLACSREWSTGSDSCCKGQTVWAHGYSQGWFTQCRHSQGDQNYISNGDLPLLPAGHNMDRCFLDTQNMMQKVTLQTFRASKEDENGVVGILLTDYWVATIFDMVCIWDQMSLLKSAMGNDTYNILTVYAHNLAREQLLW